MQKKQSPGLMATRVGFINSSKPKPGDSEQNYSNSIFVFESSLKISRMNG
jgi:hypothetical protein